MNIDWRELDRRKQVWNKHVNFIFFVLGAVAGAFVLLVWIIFRG